MGGCERDSGESDRRGGEAGKDIRDVKAIEVEKRGARFRSPWQPLREEAHASRMRQLDLADEHAATLVNSQKFGFEGCKLSRPKENHVVLFLFKLQHCAGGEHVTSATQSADEGGPWQL